MDQIYRTQRSAVTNLLDTHIMNLVNSIEYEPEDGIINDYVGDVVAIGDIHGDFDALITCLFIAGLINENAEWIGENTIVVQTGDILDDGRPHIDGRPGFICEFHNIGFDEILIFKYLADLNIQAKAHNSRILLCIGNHELSSYINYDILYHNYVLPKTKKIFGRLRRNLLSQNGKLIEIFAKMFNAIVKINNWVFLHGGIEGKHIASDRNISILNNDLKTILSNGKIYTDQGLEIQREKFINFLLSDGSVLSSRKYGTEITLSKCNDYLELKKGSWENLKMVIGHTINNKINSTCGTHESPDIYRIDTGMSRAFGCNNINKIAVLKITWISGENIPQTPQTPRISRITIENNTIVTDDVSYESPMLVPSAVQIPQVTATKRERDPSDTSFKAKRIPEPQTK